MKTLGTLLFLMALFSPAARADYIIVYLFQAFDQDGDFAIKLKDTKSRIDYADGSILIESKNDYITVLNHTSKTYEKMTGDLLVGFLNRVNPGGLGDSETAPFTPSGKTETINGYQTRELVGQTAGVRISVFLADDVSSEQKLSAAIRQIYGSPAFDSMRGIASLLEHSSGIPVRIVYDLLGLEFTMTLQSAQDRPLDESEFTIPSDYREVK